MIKDLYGNTRFFGVYRGVVFDSNDPLGKDRIQVILPQILSDFPTQWCWPVGVVGSGLPAKGDGVWVQFEGGDPSFPVWLGSFTDNLISTSTSLPAILDGGTA